MFFNAKQKLMIRIKTFFSRKKTKYFLVQNKFHNSREKVDFGIKFPASNKPLWFNGYQILQPSKGFVYNKDYSLTVRIKITLLFFTVDDCRHFLREGNFGEISLGARTQKRSQMHIKWNPLASPPPPNCRRPWS